MDALYSFPGAEAIAAELLAAGPAKPGKGAKQDDRAGAAGSKQAGKKKSADVDALLAAGLAGAATKKK